MMPLDDSSKNSSWKDYKHLSELFRFYLELVFKAFSFTLGVTGAVVAFVLGKDVEHRHIASFGILLPAILCIGMGVAFWRAVRSADELTVALDQFKIRVFGGMSG